MDDDDRVFEDSEGAADGTGEGDEEGTARAGTPGTPRAIVDAIDIEADAEAGADGEEEAGALLGGGECEEEAGGGGGDAMDALARELDRDDEVPFICEHDLGLGPRHCMDSTSMRRRACTCTCSCTCTWRATAACYHCHCRAQTSAVQ